jgi:hypothetical protein
MAGVGVFRLTSDVIDGDASLIGATTHQAQAQGCLVHASPRQPRLSLHPLVWIVMVVSCCGPALPSAFAQQGEAAGSQGAAGAPLSAERVRAKQWRL